MSAFELSTQVMKEKELAYRLEYHRRGLRGIEAMIIEQGDEAILSFIKAWVTDEGARVHQMFEDSRKKDVRI